MRTRRSMVSKSIAVAACWLASLGSAFAATVSQNDYAQGIAIIAPVGLPLVEMAMPDDVYRTITRPDLGDVRVFNADGVPVPHALCSAPETSQSVISELSLPVFQLNEAAPGQIQGSRIEVQTAGGTQVNVQESTTGVAAARRRTHIIDGRENGDPLRAIQFVWRSPDGASEVKVSIESSDDLDRWRELVSASTLLRVTRGTQEIKRERIELPVQVYKYLRVQRADGGPPLVLDEVIAESVTPGPEVEPFWFMATAMASDENGSLLFDTARLAPVRYARLRLGRDNSSVQVAMQSRSEEKSPWRERWSGEAYLIVSDTQRRESPPARFAPTTDRQWRVQIAKDPQLYKTTLLEFGYRPARLRFLAQGSSPFTLAFGSRRTEVVAATACDALLADVSVSERAKLIGEGYPQGMRELGGQDALTPVPQKTPVRLVVLWAVLISGVALLVAMAMALMKRVRVSSG
jgi:hypothetical protein